MQRVIPVGRLVRWATLSLLALPLAVGCGKGSQDPVTSKTSNFEVAEDAAGGGKGSLPAASVPSSSPAAEALTGTPGRPAAGAAAGTPQQPPAIPGMQLDSFTVPEGAPKQLLEFIDRINQGFAQLQQEAAAGGQSEDELLARVRKMLDAKRTAAEKILAVEVDEPTRSAAVMAKLESLGMMIQAAPTNEVEAALQQFKGYCQTLAADKNPELARQGKVILFRMQLEQFLATRKPDAAAILKELQALLADENRDLAVLEVTQQAVMALRNGGAPEVADQAFRMVADAYKDSQDPQLASEARNMLQHLKLVELDYDAKLVAALKGEPNAVEALLAATQEALAQDQPGSNVLRRTVGAQISLEMNGNYDQARQLAATIGPVFAASLDEKTRSLAQRMLEPAQLRLELLGKPLTIIGTLPDGAAFDAAPYQGKVVLVNFWFSQHAASVSENQRLKQIYEKYRPRGLEIIGVALDQNRIASGELPWPNLFAADPLNDPFSKQCGVDINVLPLSILLDQQGTVVDLHLRGDKLEQRLVQLLGPAAAPSGGVGPPAGGPGQPPSGSGSSWRRGRPGAGGYQFVSFGEPPAEDEAEEPGTNPYLPRDGLSVEELVDFILTMEEKPATIQGRAGFAEALLVAADRVLDANAADPFQVIAAKTKFRVLHEKAVLGDEDADRRLWEFVDARQQDRRAAIAEEVQFFNWERRLIAADQSPPAEIPALLAELDQYLATRTLSKRYLRLASSTVAAINRLEDGAAREKYFQQFGQVFAKSGDSELARYGKKLAKPAAMAESALVGQPLELSGATALGTALDWNVYRGKVVLVDFWATWCGPCVREMPAVRALHDELKDRGFDIVAVSLDENQEDLAKFLEENKIPWPNLIGDDAKQIAEKYGVRAIPTMMLVDRQGKVLAVSHQVAELAAKAREALK